MDLVHELVANLQFEQVAKSLDRLELEVGLEHVSDLLGLLLTLLVGVQAPHSSLHITFASMWFLARHG